MQHSLTVLVVLLLAIAGGCSPTEHTPEVRSGDIVAYTEYASQGAFGGETYVVLEQPRRLLGLRMGIARGNVAAAGGGAYLTLEWRREHDLLVRCNCRSEDGKFDYMHDRWQDVSISYAFQEPNQ